LYCDTATTASKEGGGGGEPEERAEGLRGKGRASGLSDASA